MTAVAARVHGPRAYVAALLLALAAAAIAIALAAGGGSATTDSGPLDWAARPTAFTHPTMPTDHIVFGKVRNDGTRQLRIVARTQIKVRAADGTDLVTAAVFSQTYGHQMFDPTRLPQGRLPEQELMRIGDVGKLDPGAELPVTISWHEDPRGPKGARIYYPGGSLEIPPER